MKEVDIKKLKEMFDFAEKMAMIKSEAADNAEEKIFFQGMAIQANIFMKSISILETSFPNLEIKEINIEDVMKDIGWN